MSFIITTQVGKLKEVFGAVLVILEPNHPTARSTFGTKYKECLNNFRTPYGRNPIRLVSNESVLRISTVSGAYRYFPTGALRRSSSKKFTSIARAAPKSIVVTMRLQ